jgi:hypothetical protein
MIQEYRQLVEDISQQMGVEKPLLMEEGSPVLDAAALRQDLPMYLVGLIGGKDVGKSSLVNALVGQEITARTSHGPGTEIVIAYAHEAQAAALRALLDREVSGQYRIVTHTIPRLYRQVLLDLPDIDSHYAHHVEVTRRMLRHMLYPIWLQSVEKYADRRPRELLATVAAGNAPQNFIFCLNKADQLVGQFSRRGRPRLGNGRSQLRRVACGRCRRAPSPPSPRGRRTRSRLDMAWAPPRCVCDGTGRRRRDTRRVGSRRRVRSR